MRGFVIFFLAVFGLHSSAQLKLGDVDLDHITQRKVRKYIQSHSLVSIAELKPSFGKWQSPQNYFHQEATYFVNAPIDTVWENFLNVKPDQAWNCKKVGFGVLLSQSPEHIFYSGDTFSKMAAGQTVIVNLRLLGGLLNLAVPQQIVNVDPTLKFIELSYLKGHISKGKQSLKFSSTENGMTKIVHVSNYRSGNKVRDKWFYPFFHKNVLAAYHKHMRQLIESSYTAP